MKSVKITNRNYMIPSSEGLDAYPVKAKFFNDLHDDVVRIDEFTTPLVESSFDGTVNLSKSAVIYPYYTLDSNLAISIKSYPAPVPGAYAEVTLIADGSNTCSFASDMTATPSSDSYNSATGTINKIGIYYDGVYKWYTITPIVRYISVEEEPQEEGPQ